METKELPLMKIGSDERNVMEAQHFALKMYWYPGMHQLCHKRCCARERNEPPSEKIADKIACAPCEDSDPHEESLGP